MWASHVANGRCFTCGGAGRVSAAVAVVTEAGRLDGHATAAVAELQSALGNLVRGDEEAAQGCMHDAVRELRRCGTERARWALGHIASRDPKAPRELAVEVRRRVIELGRAA